MKRRVLLFLSCWALCAATGWGLLSGIAHAASLPAEDTPLSGPHRPLTLRAGSGGCGWDYACPPDRRFERRFRQLAGQIYIHNNYGPIHIHTGRPRPPEGPVEQGACGGAPCQGGIDCGSAPCEGATGCGGHPCREDCGAFCWMRRFKHGYCGHGCWAYREQARIEAEERIETEEREGWRNDREEWRGRGRERECPLPNRGRDCGPPPRPVRRAWREDAPPRDERPSPGELGPRERFDGPRYPADCTHGGC